MRVPVALKIALLAVGTTGFYTYIGQLVPQKMVMPPEAAVELAADLTTEEMVEIGRGIFEGKGLCLTCHTLGQQVPNARFPDLAGVAGRAGQRVPGLSPLEYLAQSLYEPEEFIVPGFTGGMPPIHRPPVGLTDDEIRTVLAYLQTLGGEATITPTTPLPYGDNPVPLGGGGEDAAAAQPSTAAETVEETADGAAADAAPAAEPAAGEGAA